MDDLRFALIGYGLFGSCYADAIERTRGAELVAITARSAETQGRAEEEHPDARVFADYREMLAAVDCEVVCVVAPNSLHHQMGVAALESGRHLLLEKPMALEVKHCDELITAARARGLVLAIGHELRLSSLWGGVRRLIDEGRIGAPQHALVELSRFPYRQGSDGWRYDPARVGDWILEEPIHFFDLARWYLEPAGVPRTVYARANSRDAARPELRDNFSAIVACDGGAYLVVSQTLAAFEHHVTAKVVGTEAAIHAYWSAPDARSNKPRFGLRYGLGERITEVPFGKIAGELIELEAEIARMVDCARGRAVPHATGDDGRWSTLLCLAAARSVETGAIVDLGAFVAAGS